MFWGSLYSLFGRVILDILFFSVENLSHLSSLKPRQQCMVLEPLGRYCVAFGRGWVVNPGSGVWV